MRVFVYEYICGGGLAGQSLPDSLQSEGWAMLTAVVDDFRRLPDVQTTTLLDPRMAGMVQKRRRKTVDWVEPGAEFALFRDHVRDADFTLVIAPEFDDILFDRCRWTEEVGGRLLGPSSAVVRLAADKLRLAELWQQHDIPTPTTRSVLDSTRDLRFPLVCKPRHGAGSQANFLIQNEDQLRHALREGALMGVRDDFILQPYAWGTAASVSILLGGAQCYALPAAQQRISFRTTSIIAPRSWHFVRLLQLKGCPAMSASI
jgi:predicted ATP-grasp superfamily ATP-dependent carboligase